MNEHHLADDLRGKLENPWGAGWRVVLVGAGGNGSKALVGLKNLSLALEAIGWRGLEVTVYDPDTVSEANLVRQAFYACDVGRNKAVTLVNRLNLSCGLDWKALPVAFGPVRSSPCELLVSCVDSGEDRLEVSKAAHMARYWLDLANGETYGQAVLGQPKPPGATSRRGRLPTVAELFPSILEPDEARGPSCSAREALSRQDLFVGDAVVTLGLNLVWRLLRHGQIEIHGGFVNLETGCATPLAVGAKHQPPRSRSGARG